MTYELPEEVKLAIEKLRSPESYIWDIALETTGIRAEVDVRAVDLEFFDNVLRAGLEAVVSHGLRAHCAAIIKSRRVGLLHALGLAGPNDPDVAEVLGELSGTISDIYKVVVGTGLDARVVDAEHLRKLADGLERYYRQDPVSDLTTGALYEVTRTMRALANQARGNG